MTSPDTPTADQPLSERILLWILMLIQFTTIVDFMIIMPLSSYLMQEMQIDTGHFGLVVSAYAIAAAVSSLLAAAIADRFDRRHALLFTYAGLAVATLGCALANGHWAMLAARAVAGVFGGVLGSITLAIVGDIIPIRRRGQAMSVVMLGFSLAAVVGVPAGLFIAAHFGWRVPFVALTVLCLLIGVAAWYCVPSVRGHLAARAEAPQQNLIQSWRELLAVPNHWRAFVLTFLLMFSGFLIIPYIAPSLVANVGLTQTELGWIYLVGGAGTFFSRPILGRLTDKYPYARVLTAVVIAACVPMMLITLTLPLALPWQLMISMLFFVLVSGRFIPAMAMTTASTEPRFRGRVMAFNSAVQNFGSGSAAFIAGLILSTAPDGRLLHYELVGMLACFVGLFAIWAGRKVKRIS
ncbi:MFS transporter [Viridibacterium curvum]|uniref:MFS transporter n=1 Tax=Viridibacterium curvum TaxID=1101404 RepID=A0ABP9QKI1_9RHOO